MVGDIVLNRNVRQISPDKDVNCRCTTAAFTLFPEPGTTAAFTLFPEPGALLCCANLPGNWALYAVSVRRLTALHSGFLQTASHEDALAVG